MDSVKDRGFRLWKTSVLLYMSGRDVDGEQAMSACLYTPQEADGISFYADGSAIVDIEKYGICTDI